MQDERRRSKLLLTGKKDGYPTGKYICAVSAGAAAAELPINPRRLFFLRQFPQPAGAQRDLANLQPLDVQGVFDRLGK